MSNHFNPPIPSCQALSRSLPTRCSPVGKPLAAWLECNWRGLRLRDTTLQGAALGFVHCLVDLIETADGVRWAALSFFSAFMLTSRHDG
jgi:hypothetical protein